MADPTQFVWTHKELLTLMLKDRDIHEGRWVLLLNWGMSPGNFGPSESEFSPGMLVASTRQGSLRQDPGRPTPPQELYVDAAEINPAPKGTRARTANEPSRLF